MPSARSRSRRRLWFESEPLWTRHRSSPVENGCEPSVVTFDSVAIRVWPSAWLPLSSANAKRSRKSRRVAGLLVDLDRLARAHHAQLGIALAQPGDRRRRRRVSTTITAWLARTSSSPAPNASASAVAHAGPVVAGRRRVCRVTLQEPGGAGSR